MVMLVILAMTTLFPVPGYSLQVKPADATPLRVQSIGFGPTTTVNWKFPSIRWSFQPKPETAQITAFEMKVNGKVVTAEADPHRKQYLYTPAEGLDAGKYDVECKVTLDNKAFFLKKFSFQIGENPESVAPAPSATQKLIMDEVNAIHQEMGHPQSIPRDILSYVAQKHSDYMAANGALVHDEVEGKPCFVGATSIDRLANYGMTNLVNEVLGRDAGSLRATVREIYHAPYHRISFLVPGPVCLGAGINNGFITILNGSQIMDKSVLTGPAPDQKNIPRQWVCTEKPSPLRSTGRTTGITGYPVVALIYGYLLQDLSDFTCSLKLDGKDVPMLSLTPGNDEFLKRSVIMIPNNPLLPNRKYDATFSCKVKDQVVSKEWSFTTAAK
jgi:hypothetical protein